MFSNALPLLSPLTRIWRRNTTRNIDVNTEPQLSLYAQKQPVASRLVWLPAVLLALAGTWVGAVSTAHAADVNFGVIRGLTTSNLAQDSGLLQDKLQAAGHTLQWRGPYSGTPYDALNAGQVDITFTTSTNAAAVALGNSRFKIFGYQEPDRDGEGIWVKKDAGIKTLQDLKGKKIASDKGGTGHHLLLKALQKTGLTLDDVQVSFFDPAEALAAFNSGQVDALSTWRTFGASAESRGNGVKLADGNELGSENLLIYIVRDSFAQAHPEAVKAVFAALQEAAQRSAANPEATAEVWARLGKLPLETARIFVPPASRTFHPVDKSLIPTLDSAAQTFVDFKVIPRVPDYSDFIFDVNQVNTK